MKKNATQQEILLLTKSRFNSRQWSQREEKEGPSLSPAEQLEQACWNGLLPEMLPEICQHAEDGKDLYLWDIKEGASFLSLELAEFPEPKDHYFSIDPYTFLKDQILS